MGNCNRQHRRSIRLPDHDYTGPGHYLVTVCAHRRAPIFGRVPAGTIRLSDWVRAHADTLGRRYANELARRRDRRQAYAEL